MTQPTDPCLPAAYRPVGAATDSAAPEGAAWPLPVMDSAPARSRPAAIAGVLLVLAALGLVRRSREGGPA